MVEPWAAPMAVKMAAASAEKWEALVEMAVT